MRALVSIFFVVLWAPHVFAEPLEIDSFDRSTNLLGGKAGVYAKAPSRALALRTDQEFYGESGKSLMLKYDKKGSGGPYGNGGWCGYYTEVTKGGEFLDASEYRAVVFYLKGAKGGENFMVGIADKEWHALGDSVKSDEVWSFLEGGEVTTEWQRVYIPLSEFALDKSKLASIAFCFETACFPGGEGRGTIYIDDLRLE